MRDFIATLDETRAKQRVQIKQILRFFSQEGSKTIPELCDFTLLSVPTATKIVNDLMNEQILQPSGQRESGGGRPPAQFGLNPKAGYIIGVELLLKSVKISISNLSHETIYEYENESFDIHERDASYLFLENVVLQLIEEQAIPKQKILGVGIGITGRVNPKKGSSHTFLEFDEPLAKRLEKAWNLPVYIQNDTQLMTLGEQAFGLARGRDNVLYVNISRGLGIGIITNGVLHTGSSGFAGELGHMPFFDNKITCVCGKTGCLETEVSGIALERFYQESTGETMRYRQILRKVAQHAPLEPQKLVNEMGEKLGKALAAFVQVCNPNLVIIGGRFSIAGEPFLHHISKSIHQYTLPRLVADCEIKRSERGEKAAMLGAYALVLERLLND